MITNNTRHKVINTTKKGFHRSLGFRRKILGNVNTSISIIPERNPSKQYPIAAELSRRKKLVNTAVTLKKSGSFIF